MNPYPFGLLPGYDDGYTDDNRPSRQPGRQTLKSLITDFQTNPLPLPVWIWNCLVIYIAISVAWLLIKIGLIILTVLVHFLLIIFG